MEITTYRRHSVDCKHKDDRYHPRCGCSLWFQSNWSGPNTTLDGNNLHRGQNKWSAETRIWSEAQTNKRRLDSQLTALLEGKPVRQKVTVKSAIEEWVKFKEKNKIGIKKAKLMGGKLIAWCEENDVTLLTALTPEGAMRFRNSLPYRTGDSSTLTSRDVDVRLGPLSPVLPKPALDCANGDVLMQAFAETLEPLAPRGNIKRVQQMTPTSTLRKHGLHLID
jgi:hypothetical protein